MHTKHSSIKKHSSINLPGEKHRPFGIHESHGFLGRLDIGGKIRRRRGPIHAVTEINDVALASTGSKAVPDPLGYLVWTAVSQDGLIDIALKHQVRKIAASSSQIMARAQAYNVGAGRAHQGQIG